MKFLKPIGLVVEFVLVQIGFLIFVLTASAQPTTLTVGTSGNKYILSIQNKYPWGLDSVHVKVVYSPQWIIFNPAEVVIDSIPMNQRAQASFDFSVSDVKAGLNDSVKFMVTDQSGNGYYVKTLTVSTGSSAGGTGLDAAYPNPSNPSTTIRYSLGENSEVSLIIYDILGRQVRTLVNEEMVSGKHNVVWNGINDRGTTVSSGVYFIRLTTRNKDGIKYFTSKILMLK